MVSASTKPSINDSVWGVRPGPSQSHHIGLEPRTRGGSSIWTPADGGRLTGVCLVLSAQRPGNLLQVGEYPVHRQVSAECVADVFGERPVAAAEEERVEIAAAAVAVDRDRHLDVIEECCE